ncbi:MAG: glycoside hydrolase family 2 protein [Faecalibacterium sp.]|nr:glycoside hydrolase family 2 protein [Ruminococcus sp.]MCM1393046.1 glycoside hydrolase family 2 protein [Ruminococcus sp.]MCM1486683.1 glycoside hydrolase family 2 protein [Faecalibacterium sp.]
MRNITNINENWLFSKKAKNVPTTLPTDWEGVNLPHTWNGKDGQDGGNDYYRGKCYYAKILRKDDLGPGKIHYLQFDGVNSSAEVFWNGEKLAEHHGGYSTFRVKLPQVHQENLLVVSADNAPNDFVYPQIADFTFYGGIYRDVSVIAVNENHFDLDYHGAPGIMVTPTVNGINADVHVQAFVKANNDCNVLFEIIADGKTVSQKQVSAADAQAELTIENAHLWNGTADPYLYTMKATLICGNQVVDEVSTRFGCRSFKIDPEKGFILNGKEYPLRGVSRHQDRPDIGNALTAEHHKEDMDLIWEMGANTIRLAHYQHSQTFYDLCDERGMVVWAEIPYISKHMSKGTENTVSQMTELVCQNYNHPSIAVWGLSNEITMNGAADQSLIENHRKLNDLAHKLDKTRPTTIAVLSMCSPNEEYTKISDVLSYNHYFGWYGGLVDMYGSWFDKFHKANPNKAIGLSEYGCEALNWHTSSPEQGDYTEEYQAYYHEEVIKQIAVRPYLWATHVWNMFDFAADARSEGGENGMNHKGLVTFDRKYKKDSFYAYKAWLSDEPMIHICGKRYVDRVEDITKVTVYSNRNEVELFANGESIGKQQKGEYPFFKFDVPLNGEMKLTAKAGDLTDESFIRKVDTFNQDYVLQEEGAVINWFEIETPPGYYSINDTIGDILSTFKGKITALRIGLIALKALKSGKGESGMGASAAEMKINKQLIEMGKSFTIKRLIMMAGGMFTKEEILQFNAMLNKVKKK